MDQNAFSQSDCRLFESTIPSKKKTKKQMEYSAFFTYWCKLMKSKNWLKMLWVCIVKNGCDYYAY